MKKSKYIAPKIKVLAIGPVYLMAGSLNDVNGDGTEINNSWDTEEMPDAALSKTVLYQLLD